MRRALATAVCAALAALVPVGAEVMVNDLTDIALQVFVPCANGAAGEVIDLSGPLHTLITYTINGNNVSGKMHFQPQGISGTGESTGLKYQATGVTQQSFKISLQNGQVTLPLVNDFRMIGQGPGNNFLVLENLHITAKADGTLTVFHDRFSVECK